MLALLLVPGAWCLDSPVVVNEVFVDGTSNYPDWIELYNTGDEPVSLQGFVLTDDIEEERWTIQDQFILPPKGFKVFYCDRQNRYDHASFGLGSISGEVGLFSPQGELLDAVSYDDLPRFSSLGRWPDGSGDFFIHDSPTKGSANQESTVYLNSDQDVPISFSQPSGLYDQAFGLVMTAPGDLQVRFTTDGSLPDGRSRLFKRPLDVDETTIVRAAAVTPEGRVLSTATMSYIFNETTKLPVVSVVTDPKNLWDPEIGIYVEGDSQKYGVGDSQNWNNNWRRPVHLDFIAATGNWQVDGRMRMFGGTSRDRPQKPMAIFTTSKEEPYGIRQQIFPGETKDRYAGIVLRNGGDTWLRTQLRDSFQEALVKNRVACDTMPYRPVIVYLNGEYWGLYGLRELMSRKNLLARHDLPLQRVALMDEGGPVASDQGPFANQPPIPTEGDWRPAMAALDIDSYLDYLCVEFYSGNPDWPNGNIKCWRPESGALKWRWVLFDLDRGFHGKRGKPVDYDPFAILYRLPEKRNLMFPELAQNKLFVRDFCARMVVHVLTTFAPERALAILDRMAAEIRPEMQRHIDRWRWEWKLERLLMTVDDWEDNLEKLRDYCRQRPQAMLKLLASRFAVGEPKDTRIEISTQGQGRILAEGVPLDHGRLEGPVPESLDIVITAVPAEGYVFTGWAGHPDSGAEIRVTPGQTFTDCAMFEPIDNQRGQQ